MPELIVVGVRAETWQEPAMVLLKEPITDRYLPIAVSTTAGPTRHQPGAGVSAPLVQDLLSAVGAPARWVEIAEASAGADRVVLIVGAGVRVAAAPLEAISFALDLGLPIRCADAVIDAEGVAVGPAQGVGTQWKLAGATPAAAPTPGHGPDATAQMEPVRPGAVHGDDEPLVRPPAGVAILHIRQGPAAGAVFTLDADVLGCGRDGSNRIVLDGATVSRKHAEFYRRETRYVVSDLGSLNGTYVNGERVKTAVLATGDQIRIGRYVLSFVAGE